MQILLTGYLASEPPVLAGSEGDEEEGEEGEGALVAGDFDVEGGEESEEDEDEDEEEDEGRRRVGE